ncbi:MAG: DUF3276 family protein [Bacteroidia bacterium]
MEPDNRNANDSVFSRKIRAGRRRTYFFDVRTTKSNDYYLTITESKKRNDNNGYERHKVFIYKEDFNKFLSELTDVVNYIKSQMPDFDFDSFNHVYEQDGNDNNPRTDSGQDEQTMTQGNLNTEKTDTHLQKDNNDSRDGGSKSADSDAHEDLKW